MYHKLNLLKKNSSHRFIRLVRGLNESSHLDSYLNEFK